MSHDPSEIILIQLIAKIPLYMLIVTVAVCVCSGPCRSNVSSSSWVTVSIWRDTRFSIWLSTSRRTASPPQRRSSGYKDTCTLPFYSSPQLAFSFFYVITDVFPINVSFTEVRMTHLDWGEAQGFFIVSLQHTHPKWLLRRAEERVKPSRKVMVGLSSKCRWFWCRS